MKKNRISRRQYLFALVAVLPFLVAVLLSLIGLYTLDDIALDVPFHVNVFGVVFLLFFQIGIILVLYGLDKIDLNLPKSKLKRVLSVFGYLLLFIMSSFLLVITLKMNVNYWLRSDKAEKLELIVVDKNISRGKSTDYYIIFESKKGKFQHKISSNNYKLYRVGESFKAGVKSGYFDGYYLSEPLK